MAMYYSDYMRWLRAPRRTETPALAFSAVPKVGGTTIENALVSHVETGVFSFTDHGLEHGGKWQSCKGADCRLLLGHGTLADMRAKVGTATASSLATFMLFREPLARSMSSYHYYFLSTKNRRKAKPNTYITVLQYAAQPRWCNVQTRYLAGNLSPIYTDEDGKERLRRAVLNLRNVTAIGVTAHLEESLGMLEAVWQTVTSRAGQVAKENANPRNASGLTEAELAALRTCDALDNKLFVHVRRRFVAQRAACRATGKCSFHLLTPWEPWANRSPFQRMSRRATDQPPPSLAVLPPGRTCYHSCQDTCWSYRPPACSVNCGAACKQSCCSWWGRRKQTSSRSLQRKRTVLALNSSQARVPRACSSIHTFGGGSLPVGVYTLPRHNSGCIAAQLSRLGFTMSHEQRPLRNSGFDFDWQFTTGAKEARAIMLHSTTNPLTFVPWCARAGIAQEFQAWAAAQVHETGHANRKVECMRIWTASHRQIVALEPTCSFQAEALPARHICQLLHGAASCSRVPYMLNSTDTCRSVHKQGSISWAKLSEADATGASEMRKLASALGYT